MKNTYITIIIVVLVAGFLYFGFKSKKLEAPISVESTKEVNVASEKMPTIDTPNTGEMSAVKDFIIKGQNFSFEPSLITVRKGDRVKITFENTSGFHDFRIDEYGVATKQTKSPTTEVLEFTADKVGSFEYYCSVGTHRALGMKGILKVE